MWSRPVNGVVNDGVVKLKEIVIEGNAGVHNIFNFILHLRMSILLRWTSSGNRRK